jgi:hypothetical protein
MLIVRMGAAVSISLQLCFQAVQSMQLTVHSHYTDIRTITYIINLDAVHPLIFLNNGKEQEPGMTLLI